MEATESKIREMIIEQYGSLKKFCDLIQMPWTTLDSILKRGFANSNITNVMKITKELGIDTEQLALGEIVKSKNSQDRTMAAHLEGDDFTPEEWEDIRAYAEYVKTRRK